MKKEAIVFEVSERSFEKYVIGNSDKVPVLVAFIGVWSEPCILMTDMLAGLAAEFAEQFVLAKVDIDENESLKQRYQIENIPTLKVFIDGEVRHTEEGQLSEDEARELLKSYGIVNETEDMRLQARQLHVQGETAQAIILLTQAIRKDPSNIRVALDMVQVFIDVGDIDQANALLQKLPESARSSEIGLSLTGQLWIISEAAKTPGLQVLKERLLIEPDDFSARFDSAICEIAEHNYQQALDHLFYIQENDAEFREGAAREMIVTIINTLVPNNPEIAQQYRSRLAAILSA